MIYDTRKFIEKWRQNTQWQNPAQVEQDLIISRVLVDLYNEPRVSEALVFRGGTALNKLFLRPAARYSEDIDFVQKNADPIGQTIDAIREILKQWLGDPKWKITQRGAKVLPLRSEEFNMQSDWWSGNAKIATYEINELMATKLRALYQRRKGCQTTCYFLETLEICQSSP